MAAELKDAINKSATMKDAKYISVLPPDNKPPEPTTNDGPERDENKVITRAGMIAQLKRNGSVLFDSLDATGPRTYRRIEDLPSDEQIAAYVKAKAEQVATIGASKESK